MVAVVSCYFKHNYGSVLQAFATQAVLDKLGVDNETINITGFKKEISASKRKYYIHNLFNIPMYQAKKGFVRHIVQRRFDPNGFGGNIRERNRAFKRFEENHFHLSRVCMSKNELTAGCVEYSGVLLGSDQLWLPLNIEGDYYTLNFVPGNVNKIAYATSFGVASIPNYLHSKTRNFLYRIDHLSTREASGQKIIYDLTGKRVPVVCDPSMLLTGDEWAGALGTTEIFKKPYIFCYFLGNNERHREFANKLKQKIGLPIVTLRHLDEYVPTDNAFGDIAPYDISPADFLNLIRHADYICTDSFHGTVFSVLFKRNFSSFRRFAKATRESTNSRVEDFLLKLGLESKLISGTEPIESVLGEADYTCVDTLLNDWRTESMAFLTTALEGGAAE